MMGSPSQELDAFCRTLSLQRLRTVRLHGPQPESYQLAYNLIKGQGESQSSLRESTRHEVDEQWPQKGLQSHKWSNWAHSAQLHLTVQVVEQGTNATHQH